MFVILIAILVFRPVRPARHAHAGEGMSAQANGSTPRKQFPVELIYLAVLIVYPLLVYPENALFR